MRAHSTKALGARLVSVAIAVLSLGAPSASAQDAAPKLTAAQWQADLNFLAGAMPRQHHLYRRTRREEIDAAVGQLHDQIPTLNEDEIIVGLMRIVALVRDGHTGVFPHAYFRTGVYPLRFYLYRDGLFVKKAAPAYAGAVGGRVLRIGSKSTEDALKLVSQLVSADNVMGAKENAPILLAIPELLAGLKINDDKQSLNLSVEVAGKERTFQVKPSQSLRELLQPPPGWADAAGAGKTETPLYLKDPKNLYWFEYLKDRKLVYVQQNAVQNKPDETVGAFYRRVFEFVAANPVEKFVLDLRHNDGGNNGLNRQVVRAIIKSKIDERGKLFVITGRATFSAAQNFVNELEKYTKAIFVGEPTAAHPNHYGDATPITLPNSKLEVRVSTIYWQDVDPRDARTSTAPEIAADQTSSDYRDGRDPALQAVFDYVPGSSFADLIEAAASQKEIAGFVGRYKAFKGEPKNRFVETEAAMNSFGYTLLGAQRVADALEIFRLNAEAYPNSANVHDSLGDALAAAGRKDDAIRSYEKALSIDPNYSSSLTSLRRLKGN